MIWYFIGVLVAWTYFYRISDSLLPCVICSLLWPASLLVMIIHQGWRTVGRLFLVLMLSVTVWSVEVVPNWILSGILRVETKSYYRGDTVIWVNRARGSHGERGCFQMLESTFNEIRGTGEHFRDLDDSVFAEYKAIQYLRILYKRHGSWSKAIIAYNGSPTYLRKVIDASN